MLLNGMPHDGESKKNGYALIHFLKYACLSVLMMPTLSTVSMSSLLSKRSGFFRQLDDSIYPEVQEMLSVYIDIRPLVLSIYSNRRRAAHQLLNSYLPATSQLHTRVGSCYVWSVARAKVQAGVEL